MKNSSGKITLNKIYYILTISNFILKKQKKEKIENKKN